MLAANVIVADDDGQARRLFTSTQRSFIDGIFRRQRTLLPPPIESIEDYWQPHERQQIESMLSCSFIGSPDTVRAGLEAFVAEHEPDELIVATSAFDQDARLRSLEAARGARHRSGGHALVPPFSVEPAAEHAELRAALYELVGRFLADYERAAIAHGLTLTQARVLGFAACEPLSQRRLAERFGCDPSNISVLVDRLAERELVERRPDPHDGRVKLVVATESGRELAVRCCQDREWLGPALDGLNPSSSRRCARPWPFSSAPETAPRFTPPPCSGHGPRAAARSGSISKRGGGVNLSRLVGHV